MGTVSRIRAAVALGAFLAVACTGTQPGQVGQAPVIGEGPGTGLSAPPESGAVAGPPGEEGIAPPPGTEPGDAGTATATTGTFAAGTTAGPTTGAGDGTTGSTTGSSAGGATAGGSTGGGGGGEQPRAQGRQQGPPEARLYDDREKFQGISDERVHFCGHAALIFAEAFDTRPEDLNVYWEAVNEAGGVYGRRVTFDWGDDAYSPDQAIAAAENCKSQDPFALIGGIGFDQIPAVRNWAEQNRMLYVHHIAVAPDRTFNYSFSAQPTVDATGTAFGEHIATRYGGSKVGILWRQSENWEPGHRLGLAELRSRRVDVVADLPVQRNQSVYNQQIAELRTKGAEVVWIWENALAAAQVIQQADAQGYRPKWVVFPFQTTLDVVGERSLDPTIDGVATWPAYTPGGYGDDYAEQGLAEEIGRFEAAYAKYRPRTRTNDILWQVWIGNKLLHDWLLTCGPECNRNSFAGLLLSGYRATVAPNCAVDFGHAASYGNHIGGRQFLVHETFRSRNGPAYRTTRWCSAHLD